MALTRRLPYFVNETSVHIDGSVKRSLETARARLFVISVFFLFCYIAICFRLGDLSIEGLQRQGSSLSNVNINTNVQFARRSIVDRNGILLATNLKTPSLYANPKIIMDRKETARQLSVIFPEIGYKALLEKLSGERSFVWIKRNLTPDQKDAILNIGQPGLDFIDEEKRVYPHGNTIAHIMGMVGQDGRGLAGVERYFDRSLLDVEDDSDKPLQLAIDIRVQSILHNELGKQIARHSALGGAGVVMDANTGEVVAMVSLPDYDPNIPAKISSNAQFNRATLGVYEMGSTFKSFTTAMALESGEVSLTDYFDAMNPIKIGRFTINDFHSENRPLSVPEIYMYSSNLGTARMADKAGVEKQKSFLKKIGMFDPVQFELPELSKPMVPSQWDKLTMMTVSYGHGISVTPLHVVLAEAALVNGGILLKPTLIKKEDEARGTRIVSQETSDKMRRLQRLVVANKEGTGKQAEASGYLVGGKTGTAEKNGVGGYDKNRQVTSFIGAFPMIKPRYVVLVLLDEPKGIKETYGFATAGWTAAPVVGRLVTQIAPLLGIRPVDDDSKAVQSMMYVDLHPGKEKALAENH